MSLVRELPESQTVSKPSCVKIRQKLDEKDKVIKTRANLNCRKLTNFQVMQLKSNINRLYLPQKLEVLKII